MRLRTVLLTTVLALASACEGAPASPGPADAQVRQRAALRPGDVHRYAFTWTVRSEGGGLADIPVQGDVDLSGELAVRVYEETAEGVLVGVQFSRLDRHRLAVLGQDVLPEPDALLGSEALVLVPADARPRDVFFAPGSASVFRRLMSSVLAHVDLTVAPGAAQTWTEVGPTGNGLAELSYARDGSTVRRTVDAYRRVDALAGAPVDAPWQVQGEGTIVLDGEALAQSIDASEALVLHGRETPLQLRSDTAFSLRREGIDHEEPIPAPDLTGWSTYDLFEAPDLDEAERELARRFAEGLTTTDLAVTVHAAGLGLRPEAGFLVRARGLLRGWPEAARELQPQWDEAPDRRTREFILDLLVSADTPEAQAVVLDVLAEQADRGDAELPEHLQHLVLLRHPTPEMANFVLDVHALALERGDDVLRRAALYPLGALARSCTRAHPELAERMLATIRAELDRATRPELAQAALGGLGNAARPEDIERALAWRDHEDRGVRAQVASSLRHADDPRAIDALFDMLEDPDRFVAGSALDVIEFYRPGDEALHRLADRVVRGSVNAELEGPLVSVLAKRGLDDDASLAALAALRDRSADPRTRLRIGRILGDRS